MVCRMALRSCSFHSLAALRARKPPAEAKKANTSTAANGRRRFMNERDSSRRPSGLSASKSPGSPSKVTAGRRIQRRTEAGTGWRGRRRVEGGVRSLEAGALRAELAAFCSGIEAGGSEFGAFYSAAGAWRGEFGALSFDTGALSSEVGAFCLELGAFCSEFTAPSLELEALGTIFAENRPFRLIFSRFSP